MGKVKTSTLRQKLVKKYGESLVRRETKKKKWHRVLQCEKEEGLDRRDKERGTLMGLNPSTGLGTVWGETPGGKKVTRNRKEVMF